MSGGSPPKPWERAGAGGTSAIPTSNPSTAIATTTSSDSSAPALPSRPDTLNTLANRNASNFSSPYNRTTPYSSPYGYGGMSSYSSPYNRFGGGYGSMYGGGMYGPQGPGQEQSLTQSYQQSTQATFQMIESIVGAFGGFAQMLESTFMATHSSFFAMVSVAEQFGNLRQTLGSVLGIFTIMRWIRTAIAKLTGRPPPASSKELTPANFASFSGRPGPDGSPATPRPSKKPFIFFLAMVVGLPYLMSKLIRALAASQEAEQQRMLANSPHGANPDSQPLDPSKLDFCRVLYDYTPQQQPGQQYAEGIDLAVKKGDLVAVLSKTDPMGNASEWWRCRARDGRMGYLPSPYLETIQRRPQPAQIAGQAENSISLPTSKEGSRAQTMTSTTSSLGAAAAARANSMKITEREKSEILNKKQEQQPPEITGKPGDISVESFQRGGFYS